MTSSLGLDGRFWPCNEDLHWCWFSPHGVSRAYCVSILNVACNVYFLAHRYIVFFSCAFMVTTPSPSVASSSRFQCSLPCSSFSMLPLYLHPKSVIDVHIKKSPSTRLHGLSAAITSSSLGILFTYMAHQSWSQNRD